jgi:hypothetical protein
MRAAITLVAIWILLSSPVFAQDPIPGQPPDAQRPLSWKPAGTRTYELFPSGDIYPVYVADQHRPTNSVAVGFYSKVRIPGTSSPRTFLAGGGRFGILRIDSSAPNGRFWQVSIDAGLDGLFDAFYENDGIGWDGNYGLSVTTAKAKSPLALRIAIFHTSAHLGDEYADRTGAQRINYTREELSVGVAWRFRPHWRSYTEVGAAYRMRSDVQERWRWQGGLEYEHRPTVFSGRMAWYGAVDLSALEERDWRLDTAIQGGLVTRRSGRAYRLFGQWYDGRSTIGQFTNYSERAFSVGVRVDL